VLQTAAARFSVGRQSAPASSGHRFGAPGGERRGEIYFSFVRRKVLQPNDFTDLDAVERSLGRRRELLDDHALGR